MESFLTVLGAVLPVYLIVGLGASMRVVNVLTAEADQSLLRLTIYLLTPCLIVDALAHNQVATEPGNLLWGPLFGFGTVALGYLAAWLIGGALGLPLVSRRTFAFSGGIYNYGFIPIPLVIALYGVDTLGVLFIFNVGTEIAIWTLGVVLLTGGSLRRAWRQILMPPVVAVAVGVTLNLTGAIAYVPSYVEDVMAMLGACAVPLALILTGATVFDFRRDVDPTKGLLTTITGVFLRMILLAGAFIALAYWLPLSPDLKRVLIIQAAMPTAMIPIILSKLYNADVAMSLRITFATSLISLFTVPFVLQFGLWLIG